ncbi:hypothetical protein WN51_00914 [Melipona quadrifasciata]|uniref:Uncharacterized protein n=1 Tax=Melipona quadrifasciata TaxID=166423 RepID=A0A0M8ZY96_9HYME|nr:hypothetical protein WN51_00914 [Melipona quadrifasciata]
MTNAINKFKYVAVPFEIPRKRGFGRVQRSENEKEKEPRWWRTAMEERRKRGICTPGTKQSVPPHLAIPASNASSRLPLAASPPSELDSPSTRYTVLPTGRGIYGQRRNTASTIYAQLWIATGHNFEPEERRCRRKSFYERTET